MNSKWWRGAGAARPAEAEAELLHQIERVERRLHPHVVLLESMNIPYIGPNLFLAPDSRQGDGCFDVVLVTSSECDRLR